MEQLDLEAWRILASACRGKELLPDWGVKQHERAQRLHKPDAARLCQQVDATASGDNPGDSSDAARYWDNPGTP